MALSVYFLADWLLVEHYIGSQTAVYGVILLIALAACAGCLALRKLGSVFEARLGDDAKKCDRIFAVMALALLAVQIIFAACSHFTPINDLSYICTSAKNYILMGADTIYEGLPSRHQEYYAVYPNNHLLFLIVLALYKIQYALTGHITNVLPTAFNLIGLNASYILMYMCARVIYKPSKALLCAVRGLLFTPLMTYVMYFYTDALGMPWLTGALFLLIMAVAFLIFDPIQLLNEVIAAQAGAELSADLCLYPCAAFALLFAGMTFPSASSITMEGKSRWIMCSLPIPAKTIFTAKSLVGFIFSAPFALFFSVVVCAQSNATAPQWILLLLVPIIYCAFISMAGTFLNYKFPKYDWTNETSAIKNSVPVLILSLGGMVPEIAVLVLSFMLGQNGFIPLLVLGGAALAGCFALWFGFFRRAGLFDSPPSA